MESPTLNLGDPVLVLFGFFSGRNATVLEQLSSIDHPTSTGWGPLESAASGTRYKAYIPPCQTFTIAWDKSRSVWVPLDH